MTQNPNDIGAGERIRTVDIQLGKVDTSAISPGFSRLRQARTSHLVACAQGICGPRGVAKGVSS